MLMNVLYRRNSKIKIIRWSKDVDVVFVEYNDVIYFF